MQQMSIFDEIPKAIKESDMFKDIVSRFESRIADLKAQEDKLADESLPAMVLEIWESFLGALVVIESDPVKEIRCTVEFLREARMEEARRGYILAEKQASLASREGSIAARSRSVISKAYADDLITGKNESIRKAQEYQIVTEDELIASYENEASAIRTEAVSLRTACDNSKIERKYYEDLLSAQRAVLLFLSRTENL